MYNSNLDNWSDNETEEEEQEQVKRDDPLPELNPEFRENVLKVKHSLYNNIVLSPDLGTNGAQDNKVLQDYLEKLNKIYIMSITSENGKKIPENALIIFPEESRNVIRTTLDWILDFFQKNHISLMVVIL